MVVLYVYCVLIFEQNPSCEGVILDGQIGVVLDRVVIGAGGTSVLFAIGCLVKVGEIFLLVVVYVCSYGVISFLNCGKEGLY